MAKNQKRSGRQHKSDLDDNFGGDSSKQTISEAVDRGAKPYRRSRVQISDDVWKVFTSRKGTDKEVAIGGLAISAGKRGMAGELVPIGTEGDADLYAINTVELLDLLTNDVLEHRKTEPVSKDEMAEVLRDVDHDLSMLEQHNKGVDLKSHRARYNAVQASFAKTVQTTVNTSTLNFRPDYNEVVDLIVGAEALVAAEIEGQINRMIAGTSDEVKAVQAQKIALAKAKTSAKARRASLLEIRTDLAATGLRDPNFKPQSNGHSGGYQNRPRQAEGRNRGPAPRGGTWNRQPSARQ